MGEYRCFKSFWGMTGPLEEQFKAVKDAGYDGFDGSLPDPSLDQRLIGLLQEYHFPYVPTVKTQGPDHFASFQREIDRALTFSPPLINSHTGRDTLSQKERSELFTKILKYEEQLPVPVSHETHRSRVTFSPMAALELVNEFPTLRLNADFSHWCCVCESLLEDQADTMARIIKNVIYIHGRVGYPQGPQAPDPAAPEYARELAAHEAWWKAIAVNLKAQNKMIGFCPEYGPGFSRYMHTLPYTDQSVADLWKVCLWAAKRFKKNVIDTI
ncbi:hypothetical protein AGMMS49587_00820 [Spirochaetia bacterium]|nr:hypothetical protein AGMMS49587_00820 [Spirochaetia bacterium]